MCEENDRKNIRFSLLWGDTESELRFKGIPRFRHFQSNLGYPNLLKFSLLERGKTLSPPPLLFCNPCTTACQLRNSFVCFRNVQSYTLQDTQKREYQSHSHLISLLACSVRAFSLWFKIQYCHFTQDYLLTYDFSARYFSDVISWHLDTFCPKVLLD